MPDQAFWNFRLGHWSRERWSRMYKLCSNITHDNKYVYDIFTFPNTKSYLMILVFLKSFKDLNYYILIYEPLYIYLPFRSLVFFSSILDDFKRYMFGKLLLNPKKNFMPMFKNLSLNQIQRCPEFFRIDSDLEFLIPWFYTSKGIIK